MNLKDFRTDLSGLDSGDKHQRESDGLLSATIYREELNTLKIDKLSNRVTIISIIIPCLIIAVMVFAYLDMEERMAGADVTKKSQVDKLSQQFEDKLNALDVKIAKNRFDLENTLPGLNQKIIALEGQMAKITSSKIDAEAVNTQLDQLAKRVAENAAQNKTMLQAIEDIKEQFLLTFQKHNTQFDTIAQQIKTETDLLKEDFSSKFSAISSDDQQIGELRKNLSLMDKKYKNIENEAISKSVVNTQMKQLESDINAITTAFNSRIETLNKNLIANISRLQKDIDQLSNKSTHKIIPKSPTPIQPSKSIPIEEKPLTQ